MSRLCSSCHLRDATNGDKCFFCDQAVKRSRGPGQAHEADGAFYAPGVLSGKPTLKIARYVSDEELEALLDQPDTVRTVSGQRPVSVMAREELERRKHG
jgi:hypothetical protein